MPSLNKLTTLLGTAAMAAAIAVVGAPNDADADLITESFQTTSCPGQFGKPFENCVIDGSPVIIKYQFDDGVPSSDPFEINEAAFSSVDGTEIDFTFAAGTEGKEGSWVYAPGVGDPDIRFVTYFFGGNLILNYEVPDDSVAACAAGTFDAGACRALATPITSGSFDLSNALSNAVFFDTDSDGPNGQEIPEPGSIALLGLGLLGLGYAARRRKLAA